MTVNVQAGGSYSYIKWTESDVNYTLSDWNALDALAALQSEVRVAN